MMRFNLTAWIALLLASGTILAGCGGAPSDETNSSAQAQVKATPIPPTKLNIGTINAIVAAVNDGTSNPSQDKICEVTGTVIRTVIKKDSRDGQKSGAVLLELRYPDYQAVQIDCYFPAADEHLVEALKSAEWVTIRGKFDSASSSRIALSGCLIIK